MANISFSLFWDQYGLKKGRKEAERAWKRLSAKDQRAAIRSIAPYREDCQRRGIAMKYPQGYLNGRRWEDEINPSNHSPSLPSEGVVSPHGEVRRGSVPAVYTSGDKRGPVIEMELW